MEKEDYLDKETSLSIGLTKTGGEVKAKSRFLAAVDRFGGNLVEIIGFPAERRVQRNRSTLAVEKKAIDEASDALLATIKTDNKLSLRVVEASFKTNARRQINKDGVLAYALEDLKNNPIDEIFASQGADELDDGFTDRFERYAEDASTDELRERWGRILAGEIRKPGSFNPKVLRAVDELNGEDALLFEGIAKYHIDGALLKPLMPVLEFMDVLRLVEAGLIIEPGMSNHHFKFSELTGGDGVKMWGLELGGIGISIPKNFISYKAEEDIIKPFGTRPTVPVYILTDTGRALCSILPHQDFDVVLEFYSKLISIFPPRDTRLYHVDKDAGQWILKQ